MMGRTRQDLSRTIGDQQYIDHGTLFIFNRLRQTSILFGQSPQILYLRLAPISFLDSRMTNHRSRYVNVRLTKDRSHYVNVRLTNKRSRYVVVRLTYFRMTPSAFQRRKIRLPARLPLGIAGIWLAFATSEPLSVRPSARCPEFV
jgi:hypothetical protein